MSRLHERYLESALDELYLGGPATDLPDRILGAPSVQPANIRPMRRRWIWLQAAAVVLALGVIGLVLYPRDEETHDPNPLSSLDGEWQVLEEGATPIDIEGVHFEEVAGTVLVKPGKIPDESEFLARKDWLKLHGVENAMNAKWIVAGKLAVCVLFGSVLVNGEPVFAKDEPRNERKEAKQDKAKQLYLDVDKLERELQVLKSASDPKTKAIKAKVDELEAAKVALAAFKSSFEAKPKQPIAVEFSDVSVRHIIDYLALHAGVEATVQAEIDFKATLSLSDVAPLEAIRTLCTQHKLGLTEEGGLLTIKQPAAETPKTFDFVIDGPLSPGLRTLAASSGRTIRMELGDDDPEISISLSKQTVEVILELVGELIDVRVLEFGDELVLRPHFKDMSNELLNELASSTDKEYHAARNRMELFIVAAEGARDSGDEKSAAEYDERAKVLRAKVDAYRVELGLLEKEQKARN